MATFASIEKGKLARRRGVSFTDLGGQPWVCDLRVLTGSDDREILAAAAADAIAQKREPKRGDDIYDFALDVETLLRAAVDSDSPDNDPRPFFKSAAQIRDALDRDRIHYLVALQTAWQDERSPLQHEMTDDQMRAKVFELVASREGEGGPFERLAQPLLWRFTRALACQLVISQMSRSPSSSTTSSPTPTDSPTSADASA